MRGLIVNADDFGLHPAVNAAIERAHVGGIVRSASVMAVGEAFEEAVAIARRCPELGVGVHLTLVAAAPLCKKSCSSLLTIDGRFLPGHLSFIRSYLLGRIDEVEVEQELAAQIKRVVDAGIQPTHLDSHQHLHVLPSIGRIVLKLARSFQIPAIRIPDESLLYFGGCTGGLTRVIGRTGLSVLAGQFRKEAIQQGFIVADHFFGMLAGGQMTLSQLLATINRLPPGISEVMVHPGENNDQLGRLFSWNYQWQEELQALTAKETIQSCESKGIILLSFRDHLIKYNDRR